MKILVTGGSGQLGRDVFEAAEAAGHDVVSLGSAELDVTDTDRVATVIAEARPDAIIHCAAWTAVDDAEVQRDAAFAVNAGGTRNVCAAAHLVGAWVVTVSTDYVFAGSSSEGYAEGDPTDPINVYGASKLASEQATLEYPQFAVARTAWLFGEHGSNFVKTIAGLAASRSELDVVVDQVGSPTWTVHLAAALVRAAELRIAGILHLAGSPTATWFEVAQEVVKASGSDCEIRPTTSDTFVRPAARPACSILRVTREDTPVVGDWREGVAAVCESLLRA